MKKFILWSIGVLLTLSFFTFLSFFDIQTINIKFIKTLWHNLIFISTTAFTLIPFLLLILLVTLVLIGKWAFRVEKLSIGGFNVLFDNPKQLFKRQVRTFLDTKRTLFKVDFEHDNIDETLNSYFETYKFIRDEMKILGDAKRKKNGKGKSVNQTVELYDLANDMVKELNNFLTTHQSNYRRWYKYIEKNDEKQFYLTPIGELQKEYGNYKQLHEDFKKVNKFFTEKVAGEFGINIEKWGL